MAYIWCLSKGIKSIDRDDLNDWEVISKIESAKEAVPQEVAKTWLDLNKRGCLPQWAIEQINFKTMEYAAL